MSVSAAVVTFPGSNCDYDAYHASNVVDVYIRNLRRKIDDTHANKLIETVRGAGYRIAAEDADV